MGLPYTVPFVLPGGTAANSSTGTSTTADVDTGGYDVLIGGYGFRLATDQTFYYSRASEQITAHRFDSSLEPGEQSLSPLPWVKAQSSFHAGAGQLNAEQGFTAFQYQQEQIEHIRYDNSQGVDVWTPGVVKRLNATKITPVSGDSSLMVTGAIGGIDYAIIGGVNTLVQAKWASGGDSAPTLTNVDLTGATFGGASNVTVSSLVTDGYNYFALLQLAAAGSIASVKTLIVKGTVDSAAAPTVIYKGPATNAQVLGCLGWAKARLLGGLGQSMYELQVSPATPPVDFTTLTSSTTTGNLRYTHPSPTWTWSAFSEAPDGILGAGAVGYQSSILEFVLDTSGNAPTLTGGETAATLPHGEVIYSLGSMLGSFLAIGTSAGLRVGTYDTYNGKLQMGPLTITTTSPVYSITGRDRFVYGSYSNQQPDGKTGLFRVDLSMVVDAGGRMAYAPDLRPPDGASTGLGTVKAVGILPSGNRVVFTAPDGVHVEQSAPNADNNAWVRTSRIRFDTTEPKVFKYGRVTGSLDSSSITVYGVTAYNGSSALGTFGPIVGGDPGEFSLPRGLNDWLQLEFHLNGANCEFNTFQVKAYPAPARQHVITLTVNCFRDETDRNGLDVIDPVLPRQRFQNLQDLETVGDEIRYVEFTNTGGAVSYVVLIDQMEFKSFSRPSYEDDFGGYITLRLRVTQ